MEAERPPDGDAAAAAGTASALDEPLQMDQIQARVSSAEGSQRSDLSAVPSAATSALTPYEITDMEVSALAIAQGDAVALAAKAPFPMPQSLLQHLQQENKWQREQLRALGKKVEKSEGAAVASLRSSEKRSRELLRQLSEEQQRREAAENAASAAAGRVASMHDEVAKYKVQAEVGPKFPIVLFSAAAQIYQPAVFWGSGCHRVGA